MSGNNSKRGRKCNDEVDRISQLTDDVIVCILSFLPLKEAAATSLVSPRWSQLWKYTPNLIFEDAQSEINVAEIWPSIESWPYTIAKTIKWVNLVTGSHKAGSLKQFTLDFTLRDFQFLAKWLHFALSRRVEILKLNFHRSSCVLDINMLATIQSSDYRFLRELTLEDFVTSGEAIERFLQNSPLLERLVLNIDLNSNLVIVGGTLNYLELGVLGAFSIKVWAPKLTCFRCGCNTSRLLLEDIPNLVDASIELDTQDTLDCFANATPNLEILTIVLDSPQAFSVPNKMSRLKKLFLDYFHVNEEFLLPVTDLLHASPCLQEFRLKVTDNGWHYTRFTGTEFIFKVPEPGKFRHCHLKVFEFTGFYIVAPDHMELLRCIVDNCVALEQTIINPLLEGDYSMFRRKLSIDYPESNKYKILPVSYDDAVEDYERERFLRIKKFTGRMLAAVVPRHVDLLIGHALSRLDTRFCL